MNISLLNNKIFLIILIIIIFNIIYFIDDIRIFILIHLNVIRGILVPKCFWNTVTNKLIKDNSGINLFYNIKTKQGDVPKTNMFGYKIYAITKESHIKIILGNSPYPFGAGKIKYEYFKPFMKDNVGVSEGCPWKHRRDLNDKVIETDKLHKYSEKFNIDTINSINNFLIKKEINYQDFKKAGNFVVARIIFNLNRVHPDVMNIFSEADNISMFYSKYKIKPEIKNNYINFLKQQIKNPKSNSLMELFTLNEDSEYEIIQQIPHLIFPISGLYISTIPRLLLVLINHKNIFLKIVNEIKNMDENGDLSSRQIYNLSYLRKCILEMVRLNCPVITTFRTVLKDTNIEEYSFKKGDQLLILNNPILRNPSYFKNPNQFIPERWNPEMEANYNNLTFNQGPQRCPGKEIAIFLSQSFFVNFIKLSGILRKGIDIITCEKINTENIEQMINTCNLVFKINR